MIIVFEGPDGSGKSTLIKKAADYLHDKNFKVEVTKFPNEDHLLGWEIRQMLSSKMHMPPIDIFQSLYIENFIDTNIHYINPTLKYEPDTIFLIDRIPSFSSFVYSSANSGSLYETVKKDLLVSLPEKTDRCIYPSFDIINKYYCKLDHKIDMVFIVKPPTKILTEHAKIREKNNSADKFDKENIIMLQDVYYDFYYERFKKDYCFTEFIKMDKWDLNLSEKDNYDNMEKEFMTILTDRLGGYNNEIVEKTATKTNSTD